MRIQTSMLIASLLLLQPTLGLASDPITIPSETVVKMKRGKKLDLVWAVPGFDGTKGFRLGRLSNESEDEAEVVIDYFPTALSALIRKDAPYSLHVAVTMVRLNTTSKNSSARVEAEGRLVDTSGTLVAAFTAHASESIGGNERDNARLAVRTIVFAMTKDLFSSALPTNEKSPAIIVAAPVTATTPVGVLPASGTQGADQPPMTPPTVSAGTPVPPVVSVQPAGTSQAAPEVGPSQPTPTGATPQPTPAVAMPQPTPAAIPPQPKTVSPLIPAATAANMKKGAALGRLWISPAYDKASGFSIGEVSYQVETRNDGIDKYLPDALAEIAKQDAPCNLRLHIVELKIRSQGQGKSSATFGVEGVLIAKDGAVAAAFATRESVSGTGDSVDDCRTAARKVVLAIAKDLR